MARKQSPSERRLKPDEVGALARIGPLSVMDALKRVKHGQLYDLDPGGDLGAVRSDASALPPIVVPGILLDVARALDVEHLTPGTGIGQDELERVAQLQGCEMPADSAVLIRTGAMTVWQERERYERVCGAGITLEAADWLVEVACPVVVGSDTPTVEQQSSSIQANPQPVHEPLLHRHGVHLLAMAYLEQLASELVYEFAFICLPLHISGASASMVSALAIS